MVLQPVASTDASRNTFYFLSTRPDILARVRQEHDEVFSEDMETTANRLIEEPQF